MLTIKAIKSVANLMMSGAFLLLDILSVNNYITIYDIKVLFRDSEINIDMQSYKLDEHKVTE